jgi:RNA polymerase sigma-70 factor (ECF subfamily)
MDETEVEKALRRGALAGDEAAWRTLYERAFAPLFAFVRRRVGPSPTEVEEVVQETWLVAVRRLRRFDPERGAFLGWLLGIATNVLRNRYRGRRRMGEVFSLGSGDAPGRATPDRLETSDLVAVAMAALPGRYRSVLRAKYQEGRTVAEIAELRSESAKAVESLLTRARGAFRRVVGKLEGGHHGP